MKKKNSLSRRILVGITNNFDGSWRDKLNEIKKLKIAEAALFLEQVSSRRERREIYQELEKSNLKKIPLVHIRNDMDRDELVYILRRYNNPFLTIHESSFRYLKYWRGLEKHLYLEMNGDNRINPKVKVEKIGGFCVDLSHFKKAEEKWSKEFLYVMDRKEHHKYFVCNHLNGYSYKMNTDLHTVTKSKNFDYLKTLPKFLFGKVVALEMHNSIKEQLKFKKYLVEFLKPYLKNNPF